MLSHILNAFCVMYLWPVAPSTSQRKEFTEGLRAPLVANETLSPEGE